MLTPKQQELLSFIHDRLEEGGVSPSFEEMKDALERIENDSTPPPPSTSDSVSIKGSKTPTIPLMTTVITNNNLTTPSAKLPLGLFFSGKLKKRSRNRSLFRSMTHVVSWKIRTFRLIVQSELCLFLEYAPPLGDRKYEKEYRKWERIRLTPDMNIALAKDCKLRPQVLKLLGDIKAKSPIDSASPESRLAFQIRQPSKIDGGIILECETTDRKMFNGWVKALGLALLSLRESLASSRKNRLRQTSSSCPTLISSSTKNDSGNDDVRKSKSQHFTASMAVKTINVIQSCIHRTYLITPMTTLTVESSSHFSGKPLQGALTATAAAAAKIAQTTNEKKKQNDEPSLTKGD